MGGWNEYNRKHWNLTRYLGESKQREQRADLYYSEGLFEGNSNYSIYSVIAISYVN